MGTRFVISTDNLLPTYRACVRIFCIKAHSIAEEQWQVISHLCRSKGGMLWAAAAIEVEGLAEPPPTSYFSPYLMGRSSDVEAPHRAALPIFVLSNWSVLPVGFNSINA